MISLLVVLTLEKLANCGGGAGETAKVQRAPESEKVCFPEEVSVVPWLAGGW